MGAYTNVILTLLTIITGVLTILSFINGRNKESTDEGKEIGRIEQKINDIDKRTETIQKDLAELRDKDGATLKMAVIAHESAKSAHKRLDSIEQRA
jgi:outer membrane murein-binding lipoprotein Lpp